MEEGELDLDIGGALDSALDSLDQVGDAWLDDPTTALDSFEQEDALLEAIANAPGLTPTEEEEEEPPPPPVALSVQQEVELPSLAAARADSAPSSGGRGQLAEPDPLDDYDGGQAQSTELNQFGSAQGTGPSRRGARLDSSPLLPPSSSPTGDGGRTAASPSPAGGKGRPPPHPPMKRSPPWRGVLLAVLTVLGMVYCGANLWEEPLKVELVPASAAAAAPEIRLPSDSGQDADEDAFEGTGIALAANGTGRPTRHGHVEVQRANITEMGLGANATASATGGNASAVASAAAGSDRARRGRRKGASELQ